MYMLYDDNGNYRFVNYCGLRKLLIEEVTESIKSYDCSEYDTIKPCVDTLVYLAQNQYMKPNFILEELKDYGWKYINIYELIDTLYALQQALYDTIKDMDNETFNKMINILENIDKEEE